MPCREIQASRAAAGPKAWTSPGAQPGIWGPSLIPLSIALYDFQWEREQNSFGTNPAPQIL